MEELGEQLLCSLSPQSAWASLLFRWPKWLQCRYKGAEAQVVAVKSEVNEIRAPTSGGQYHWVSEFAPKRHQKFLSYMVGWLCVLGWQTGIASIAFLAGGQIQGLVILNNGSYVPERWHGTLLVIAVATFAIMFNTLLARKLPLIEGIVLVLHIFGFFAVFITMWVLGPRSPSKEVFGGFQDNAGWGSVGLSVLVGQLAPIFALLGADAVSQSIPITHLKLTL